MDQVDLVDPGGFRELAGVAACSRHRLVSVTGDQLRRAAGEGLEVITHRLAELREIHQGKGGLLTRAAGIAGSNEAVDQGLPKFRGGDGGVPRKLRQPVRIIPADPGLRLLRRDHVVGVIRQHERILHCRHQACVKADHIVLDAAGIQCFLDIAEGHGGRGSQLFVVAVTRHGTAAVIPEDQHVAVGREILRAVLDKGSKGPVIRHRLAAVFFYQWAQSAIHHLVYLIIDGGHHLVLPFSAAAGVDDQVDIVPEIRLRHLHQVAGRHAAPGLQIRAAHIDHDGHNIFSIALQLREPRPGAAALVLSERSRIARGGAVGRGAAAPEGAGTASPSAGASGKAFHERPSSQKLFQRAEAALGRLLGRCGRCRSLCSLSLRRRCLLYSSGTAAQKPAETPAA